MSPHEIAIRDGPENVPVSPGWSPRWGKKWPHYAELSYKHPYWWDKDWRRRWDELYQKDFEADEPIIVEN